MLIQKQFINKCQIIIDLNILTFESSNKYLFRIILILF